MLDYKNTAFPKEEYAARLRRVQDLMRLRGIDTLMLHEIGNICWLCGVQCLTWNKYFCLIVPQNGGVRVVVQSFELYNAYYCTHLEEDEIAPYSSFVVGVPDEDPIEVSLRAALELSRPGDVVGLEYGTPCPGLSSAGFDRFRAALGKERRTADAAGLVESVRAVKSPRELEYIRQAAAVSSEAMCAVMEYARAGMSDNDLAAAAHEVMARSGSEYMCLDPIITIGPRSGIPHTTYARHRINGGDTGLLELGACINRYTGVTMRSVCFGEPPEHVRFMAEGCIDSVNAVIEHARPGALCHDVAMKAKERLRRHLETYMWHGVYGYSIGLGFPPRWDDCGALAIMENNQSVLRPGNVFHVSTTLRDLGRHSITASETVVITEGGNEVYTTVPRRLFVKV